MPHAARLYIICYCFCWVFFFFVNNSRQLPDIKCSVINEPLAFAITIYDSRKQPQRLQYKETTRPNQTTKSQSREWLSPLSYPVPCPFCLYASDGTLSMRSEATG